MKETISKIISDKEKEPWFYRYGNYLFLMVWVFTPKLFENRINRDFARVSIILTFINLIFFLPPQTTLLHSKFGKGIKGFLTTNLLGAAFVAGVFQLSKAISFVFDFIHPKYNILIPIISFFVLIGFVWYWIVKSSKE